MITLRTNEKLIKNYYPYLMGKDIEVPETMY